MGGEGRGFKLLLRVSTKRHVGFHIFTLDVFFLSPFHAHHTDYRCALGAAYEPRHHPSFVTFPRSLSDFFADRSKALLEIELDNPTVATVQALVVISGHDIGCKRDARGWLYSGKYIRIEG